MTNNTKRKRLYIVVTIASAVAIIVFVGVFIRAMADTSYSSTPTIDNYSHMQMGEIATVDSEGRIISIVDRDGRTIFTDTASESKDNLTEQETILDTTGAKRAIENSVSIDGITVPVTWSIHITYTITPENMTEAIEYYNEFVAGFEVRYETSSPPPPQEYWLSSTVSAWLSHEISAIIADESTSLPAITVGDVIESSEQSHATVYQLNFSDTETLTQKIKERLGNSELFDVTVKADADHAEIKTSVSTYDSTRPPKDPSRDDYPDKNNSGW